MTDHISAALRDPWTWAPVSFGSLPLLAQVVPDASNSNTVIWLSVIGVVGTLIKLAFEPTRLRADLKLATEKISWIENERDRDRKLIHDLRDELNAQRLIIQSFTHVPPSVLTKSSPSDSPI